MSKIKRGGKFSAYTSRFNTPPPPSSSTELTPTVSNMLKELQDLVKKFQDERENNEQTLTTINKTHERMKQEIRISPYFKQKLLTLYTNALAEAKSELGTLEQSINKISEIKREIEEKQSRPVTQPSRNIDDITTIRRMGIMRKGMLMTVLQQYALEQKVWEGDSPVSLCGAIPCDDKYKCKPDDQVAARVKTDDGDEEQWILAIVVNYNSHYHRYTVDDIDEEGHNDKKRYTVSKRRVIPLPRWKADPLVHKEALFKNGQKVLALYPQTTCFYPAIIHEPPTTADAEYSVLFEDTSYPEGYSPPLDVPQRYVLPIRETRRKQ